MEKLGDSTNETSQNIVKICLKELEGWYGKTKSEKLDSDYEIYKKIEQKEGENMMD